MGNVLSKLKSAIWDLIFVVYSEGPLMNQHQFTNVTQYPLTAAQEAKKLKKKEQKKAQKSRKKAKMKDLFRKERHIRATADEDEDVEDESDDNDIMPESTFGLLAPMNTDKGQHAAFKGEAATKVHGDTSKNTCGEVLDPMVVQKLSKGKDKGQGLFAINNIARGTRILSEQSLFTIPAGTGYNPVFDVAELAQGEIWKAYQNLSQKEKSEFALLHLHPDMIWSSEESMTDQKDPRAERLAEKMMALATFRCNSVSMDPNNERGHGIFPLIARVNHSCNPSTALWFNTTLQKMTLHAMRDIKAGEEITFAYIDVYQPLAERRKQLSALGFNCLCEVCKNPNSELFRMHIIETELMLEKFDGMGKSDNFDIIKSIVRRAPFPVATIQNVDEAIDKNDELMRWLSIDENWDSCLLNAYKRAYRYEKKLNNNEEAYEWVTKQLSLERSSHGTADDTVFEDTPRSVAYLLKTLEHDQ